MIEKEKIEEIRNKNDIVSVISEYVPLKKRGRNFLGPCPFHSEKDPSFTVSPEKQIFHCFGCNEGGNVFSFLMKIENITFIQAVAELGAKANIDLPEIKSTGPSKGETDKLYQVMSLAAQFYRENLSEAARGYLNKRGITDETIKTFGLGFAPAGWDNLFKYLVSRGVSPSVAAKTGLVLPRDQQDSFYDRFRERIIIPILDQRGRTIAFGGRGMANEEPKYLNSPDTPIYSKGKNLFGLSLSKASLKEKGNAILVEGYFDLITPYQAGITNIVASLGTALTPEQCKLLSRHCSSVTLAFDTDTAGGIATERSIKLLRDNHLSVKVITFDGVKDPDEAIRKQGIAAFASPVSYLEFRLKRVLAKHNLSDIESKAAAIKGVTEILATEKDKYIRKEYAKLAASLLKIDINELLQGQFYARQGFRRESRQVKKPATKIVEAEKNLLLLSLQNKEILAEVKSALSADDFTQNETSALAKIVFESESEQPTHYLLENLTDEKLKGFVSQLLVTEPEALVSRKNEILQDCVATIKGHKTSGKIAQLKQKIAEAEKKEDFGQVTELLNQLKSEIS